MAGDWLTPNTTPLGSLNEGSVPQVERRLSALLSWPKSPAVVKAALAVLADPRFRAREQLGAPALAVGVALLHGATAAQFDSLQRPTGLSAEIARWNGLVLDAATALRRTAAPGKGGATTPLPRAPRNAVHDAWLARAKTRSPTALPSLLEVFALGPATQVTERALALLSFARDERIADAVAAQLSKPPVRSDISVPFFPVLAMALVAHGSRAHRPVAEALTAAIPSLRWIELLLPDRAPAQRAVTSTGGPDSESGFLRWLAEAPHDLTRRRVFADWLLEQGNPRGEHLVLQLAPSPLSAKELKRVTALEKKYAAQWLQTLGKGVVRSATRFHQGVVSELRVSAWRPAEVPEPNDPQLATLTHFALEGGTNLPLAAFMRAVQLPSLTSLEVPERLLVDVPAALTRKLEKLFIGVAFARPVEALVTALDSMKLPALQSLSLCGHVPARDLEAVAKSQLGRLLRPHPDPLPKGEGGK